MANTKISELNTVVSYSANARFLIVDYSTGSANTVTIQGENYFANVTYPVKWANSFTLSSNTVIFSNLPTANPGVAGRLWSNNGVVTISSG